MPLVKRRFRVPCRGDECIKLYEYVKEKAPSIEYVEYEVSDNGLIINAYGYESEVKKLWSMVKNYVKVWKGIVEKPGSYRVDALVKVTRKTFPPEVLVIVLEKQGYFAEYNSGDGVIYTNAGSERVIELINRISELNSIVKDMVKGTATRYFALASSILTGLQPAEVLEVASRLGLAEPSDEGRYALKYEWRRAIDLFIKNSRKQ